MFKLKIYWIFMSFFLFFFVDKTCILLIKSMNGNCMIMSLRPWFDLVLRYLRVFPFCWILVPNTIWVEPIERIEEALHCQNYDLDSIKLTQLSIYVSTTNVFFFTINLSTYFIFMGSFPSSSIARSRFASSTL